MFTFQFKLDAVAGMNGDGWGWPILLLFVARSNFVDKLLLAVPAVVSSKVVTILRVPGITLVEIAQAVVVVVLIVFPADPRPPLGFSHAFLRVVDIL